MKHTVALASLLAGLASAEKIPVLSEPRALPGPSRNLSYDAWGDTLVASHYGVLHRIVRQGDVVSLLDSVVSDSFRSEMPMVLPTGSGYHVVAAYDKLAGVAWTPGTAPATTLVPNVRLGHSRPEGGFAYVYNNPPNATERHLILCAGSRSYSFQNVQGPTWRVTDSISLSSDIVTHCAIDPVTNQGVRLVYSTSGTGAQVATGTAPSLLDAGLASTPYRPTTIFAAYDGAWLGYNMNNGSVYLGGRSQGDSVQLDALRSQIQTFVAPVRKDSLIVFAIDSSLVLAKWTLGNFRILNTVKLDGRVSYGLAIADSTLWVNVGSSVLSFRVSWLEAANTRIGSRNARSDLAIRALPGRIEIHGLGAISQRCSILTLQGTLLAEPSIAAGEQATWLAPHAGLYLVRTASGTTTIMVK